MIELKSPGEVDAMAAAGEVVAGILGELRAAAVPGVRPIDLDLLARERIADAGARSSFLGYHPGFSATPYPAVICASVNDAIVHAIPDASPLAPGDLLSVDFAVHLDGWCADAAFTVVVGGGTDPIVTAAENALAAGIAAAVPGARLGDVAHAIGAATRERGFAALWGYGGHGVGRAMHEPPFVPNDGPAGRGLVLRPGMVLALEPMLLGGRSGDCTLDADGWTIRTADGSRAAHAEHTVAVTDDGPRVLTAAPSHESGDRAERGSTRARE